MPITYQWLEDFIKTDPIKIYGIQRDITDQSPEWTRTDKAVGMSATASVGTTAGKSDFSDCMPWKGMVRENIGTDVMVKIPKFYFRRYREGNIEHIEIANEPVAGFTVHPLFNHAGVESDCAYIGAYKTSSDNKSVSNAYPQVEQTRAAMRNNAKAKGAGWSLIDIAALSAIQMLFLVEYATNDSQKAIGRGYCDRNRNALQSGTCNNVPGLTGRPAGTDGKVDVVYRGIEGVWGNVTEWVDGVNFDGKTVYVCNDPSKYKDDTSTGYTKLSYSLASDGHISQEGLDTGANEHVMLPTETSGSETTYYCDYGASGNSGWRVVCVGGAVDSGSDCGLFTAYCELSSSNSNSVLGSRLLYIPPTQGAEEHPEITTPVKHSGVTVATNTTDRNHVGGDL